MPISLWKYCKLAVILFSKGKVSFIFKAHIKIQKKKPERFLSKVIKHPYCHKEICYTGFMPSWFSISFHTILKVSREIGNNGRLLGEPKYNLPSFGNTIIDSRSLPLAYSHHRIKQNLESNPNVLCDFPSCNNESNSEITRLVCFDTCHLNWKKWNVVSYFQGSFSNKSKRIKRFLQ